MSRWLIAFFVALAVCVAVPAGSDAAITVDGDLYDWGLSIQTSGHNHTVYDGYDGVYQQPDVKNPGVTTVGVKTVSGQPDIFYVMEDTYDHDGNYRVGPFNGGQDYDAQFLAVSVSDSILSIAVHSGQRPDNGLDKYAPGDIMIKVNGTLYGLEVGGGAGGISSTGYQNFTTGDPSSPNDDLAGWTYDLFDSGYTNTAHATTDPDQTVGSLWRLDNDSDFKKGLPNSGGVFNGIHTQINGGTQIGGISPVAANFGTDHFGRALNYHGWIEAQIDISALGDPEDVEFVRWAPSCANDELALTVTFPPAPPVPEPASVVVWGLLSLTAGAYTWRRKRVAQRRCE